MAETAFVIVTYQSELYIRKAIDSILLYEPSALIIVVDNDSSDNTRDIVSCYLEVILLPQEKNHGFGKANNIGISKALELSCKYIYLLNHDAFLTEPLVESLIGLLAAEDSIGVASPFQLSPTNERLEVNFERFLYQQDLLSKYISDLKKNQLPSFYVADFFQAASWFVPSKVFKTIGGFNPLFTQYGEDNDFLNRLHYHGYRSVVVPCLSVSHIGNPLNLNYPRNFNAYHINRIFVSYLVDKLDINKSLSKSHYFRDFFQATKNIVINLLIFRWKIAFNNFRLLKMKFVAWPSISNSRKHTMVKGPIYLNLA